MANYMVGSGLLLMNTHVSQRTSKGLIRLYFPKSHGMASQAQ
jgi:hypothetical protein